MVSWAAMSFLSDTSETDITGLNQVNDMDQEFNSLVTRFNVYDHQEASNTSGRVNIVTSTPVRPGTRTATDKDSFIPCKDHQTTKLCIKTCDKCILLLEQEKLPQGWLPTTSQVLAYYLIMNKNNVKTNNLVDVCSDVMLHWVLCNVYTVTHCHSVLTKLEQIVETYWNLKKYPRKKRKDT